MIELADFMAYLDCVVSGLDSYTFKYHSDVEHDKKTSSTCRARLVYNELVKHGLFSTPNEPRTLCNIFVETCKPLDKSNITDLLRISDIGKERMFTYIKSAET